MMNGPMKDTIPIPTEAVRRRRMYAGSTSIPARNVRTMEANAAMNVSQSWLWKSKALPATTPNVSSMSATVTPNSTETMLASRAIVTSTAASSMASNLTSHSSWRR